MNTGKLLAEIKKDFEYDMELEAEFQKKLGLTKEQLGSLTYDSVLDTEAIAVLRLYNEQLGKMIRFRHDIEYYVHLNKAGFETPEFDDTIEVVRKFRVSIKVLREQLTLLMVTNKHE